MVGIYEQIINQLFRIKINSYDKRVYYIGEKKIGKEEAIIHLSRYLAHIIQGVVAEVAVDEVGAERCVRFINSVIKKLGAEFSITDFEDNLIVTDASILTTVIDRATCDYPDIAEYIQRITPLTSLTSCTLFTGSNFSVDMISELKKEILSADKIDILVSFIRMSGLNLMLNELKEFTNQGKQLRIITTTYMQATEYKAIRKISELPNTEVKISYNIDTTRLHAKAYIFYRNSGFHTAYIGSSNISKAALSDGLEWNIKATQTELPHIIAQVRNTFDTYWEDSVFEKYLDEEDAQRLQTALGKNEETLPLDYSFLDLIRAKDYQNEILERLDVERDYHGHYKNLVVAATGTGKTVIAAFDYKRFKENNKRANFLFVVHREEIIKQACEKFRKVLEDENFGDMWYGGHEATNYSHLFASKDILNNRLENLHLPNDYYDYIIFDEAHHIVASTYQKILQKFKPKILLGLTATPERMDGQDITTYFDGHISAEIRLDTALNNRLLSPFRYYGITDCVDLAEVRWERGRFVASELSKIYTNNDYRTKVILDALQKYIPSYRDVRALCFCVDKEHAEMMHAKFTLAGLKSAVLTSDYNDAHRKSIIRKLTDKSINYLFVVDIFNEGVDIPYIDTVLFLRPTESLTIFLQQFGRGLRKAKGKECLTVLDFVGHSRAEFNYMDRFRALMGRTTMGVKEEIEKDFPHLPFGCKIHLEEKAKQYILENINSFINGFRENRIVNLIRHFDRDYGVVLTLQNFIQLTHVPIEKLYKGRTWNTLCYSAGVTDKLSTMNTELSRAVSRKWLSTDSFSYFSFIHDLAKGGFRKRVADMSYIDQQRLLMFYYDLFDNAGAFVSLQSNIEFHWETQNKVRQDSPTGQNYINQKQTMLLFIRKQAQAAEDRYRTMGYVYLGEVELKEYSGNKPMQIVWKLKTPMPASVCEYARKYAV